MKKLGKFLFLTGCQLSATAAFAVQPEQIAKLLADDAVPGDRVGVSVAISGNTAVIGTDQGVLTTAGNGAAYVFTKSETGVWRQQTKLMATDGEAGDGFGNSVAIDADKIVVGAPGDDDAGELSGSAYVFVRDPDGTWPATATCKITASDGALFDGFGRAVAVSGNTIFVGAPWNGPGKVYVFNKVEDACVERAILNEFNPVNGIYADDPGARFGWSISAVSTFSDGLGLGFPDGGVLVIIGAPGEDTHGKAWTLLGSRDFDPNNPNPIDAWVTVREHCPDFALPGSCSGGPMQFGWSVDIDAGPGLSADDPGHEAIFTIIGAPFYNDSNQSGEGCTDSGAAFVEGEVLLGNGMFVVPQDRHSLGDRCRDNARIGWSVAISLERRGTVLIGAPFFDPSGVGTPGYVFGLESVTESLSSWSSLRFPDPFRWGIFALLASDYSLGDTFGWAVALDDDSSVIGSRADDDLTGSAYVFQQTPLFASKLLFRIITSLNLRAGIERSLNVKVSNIEAAIDGGDVNLALNLINAFVEDIAEKSGTQLTVDQANILTLWATEIVSLLTF